MVEPLTSQMAEYLGVPGGLMIKQVSKKSEAATAGFKAFDVILKVGSDSINTLADWDRALRSNQGKPVQVTILRDKKQQTITLQVDSKHRGAVEFDDLFASGDASELADLAPGPEFGQLAGDDRCRHRLMPRRPQRRRASRSMPCANSWRPCASR